MVHDNNYNYNNDNNNYPDSPRAEPTPSTPAPAQTRALTHKPAVAWITACAAIQAKIGGDASSWC